jgi:hypothetical protein
VSVKTKWNQRQSAGKKNVVSDTMLPPNNRKKLKSTDKKNAKNHHLAVTIVTPAFHAPFARDSTRVILHRMRQIPSPLFHHHTVRIFHKCALPASSRIL